MKHFLSFLAEFLVDNMVAIIFVSLSYFVFKSMQNRNKHHKVAKKLVEKAIKELYQKDFLLKSKKTGEWHVSLNPQKKKEIYNFLGLPPK